MALASVGSAIMAVKIKTMGSDDRLIADVDSSPREKILHIPIAHRKTEIEPNGEPDNVAVKAMASVENFCIG